MSQNHIRHEIGKGLKVFKEMRGTIVKQNVWIWNHYAINSYRNQGGRHYWFAENLIKNGYKPTIFCANTFHNSNEQIETEESNYTTKELDDIPYVFVKTKPAVGNGLNRILNMVLFFFNLFSVSKNIEKKSGKPDVILASSVHPLTMVAGILVGRRMNVPVICEVRDLWPEALFYIGKLKANSLFGRLLSRGEYWIYKNADALIFTKEGDVDHIIEEKWDSDNGGKVDLSKVYYINNGVDVEAFHESIESHQLEDEDLKTDSFKVVYAGTIRPVNNVGNILEAAKRLKDEKDIEFLIYGEGTEKDELEKKKESENITNVKFKGFVNKKYIPFILKHSSVNVLNYSQEKYNWSRGNSSNKLFEYMASGTPVISTVQMGYSIIERYNIGIELEKNTPEHFAKAILEIKELPKERYNEMSQNAKNAAYDFDFKKLTDKLIHVIEEV